MSDDEPYRLKKAPPRPPKRVVVQPAKPANMVDKQAIDLDYQTPRRVLDPVDAYFGGRIGLDPATIKTNPTRALMFFTPEENGLEQSWVMPVCHALQVRELGLTWGVYVNPPYGKETRPWYGKIAEQARQGVVILALLPVNRFEQAYLQDNILTTANAMCAVRKRVSFIRPSTGEKAKGNPYASALWGFNVDYDRFKRCFEAEYEGKKILRGLGRCVRLST